MLPLLSAHLATLKSVLESSGHNAEINVHARDFIKEGSYAASFSHAAFTHAILNPPYKKIGAKSEQRLLLRKLGIETVNLYAAFLGLAIALTRPSGEIVAIVPRSFCNGAYFKRFRLWLLDHVSIRQIHVFESRTEAFRDDRVLQENVIIHLVRDSDQQEVTISSSTDPTFSDYASIQVPFVEIVRPSDEEKYIRIPSVTLDQSARLFTRSLIELGLDVSTGPVVDFRVRESWLSEPEPGAVPLLYAHPFSRARVQVASLSQEAERTRAK
jgi:adenine-specific DNA-methyltransferase